MKTLNLQVMFRFISALRRQLMNLKRIGLLILIPGCFLVSLFGCSGGAEDGIGDIPPFTLSWAIASGDIDGDGLPDLAVGHSGGSGAPHSITLWFQNQATPGNFIKSELFVTYSPMGIKLADLNGDNRLDIIVISGANISIYLQDSAVNGKFPTEVTYKMPSGSSRNIAESGDLNGDGKVDIAAVNGNGVSIFYQDPANAGVFFSNVIILENIGVTSLAIEDLNGDGLDDIAVSQYLQNKVSVFLQDPSSLGTLIDAGSYVTSNGPDYISIGDLNGDNVPDIVVSGAKFIIIYFQDVNEPGIFFGPTSYSLNDNLDEMEIGDLNQDGFNDIAVISYLSDSMLIFLQDSLLPGTFLAPARYGPPTPFDITLGDFNNDNKLDIAVACSEIDYVYFQDSVNPGSYLLPPYVIENQ